MEKRKSDSNCFNLSHIQPCKLFNMSSLNSNNNYIKFCEQSDIINEQQNNNDNKEKKDNEKHKNPHFHKRSKSNVININNNNNIKSNILNNLNNHDHFIHFNSPTMYNSYKEFSICVDQNSKYHMNMEDCFSIEKYFEDDVNKSLFCLFDGHGGSEVSNFLSKYFIDYFNKYLEKYPKEEMEVLFKKIFKNLDLDIKKYVTKSNEMGSTATIIYITRESDPKFGVRKIVYCANIGDTRSVLFTKNDCKRMTYEHKCSDKFEEDRIKKSNGMISNNRLNGVLSISRAFGDFFLKGKGLICEPSIKKMEINSNNSNFIVLCTDGIWDVVNEEDIFYLTLNNHQTETICKEIITMGKKRDSKDNMSCIVIKV